MKLDTFFEKFDLFAETPNAAEKLRELFLELAVRGQLVEQSPDDEPAQKLLERIHGERLRLIEERVVRRQDTDPVAEDEVPFSIPDSWTWTRLGAIGDWGSGSTPARGNQELYDGGITWLKSGELNDTQSLSGSEETLSELALQSGSFRRNRPGDVLLAMYGATIGRVAILAEAAVTNQAVCGCTPFNGVMNRYLFFFLLSQRSRLQSASEGGAQPNISKVKIVNFPFALPPTAEQKRIVAKVDELMALCDRLNRQRQEGETLHAAIIRAAIARFDEAPNPSNLNFLFHNSYSIPPADLRNSILNVAIQGKLVPQDPGDEPAKFWHKRLQSDPENGAGKNGSATVESPELDAPTLPLPEGWIWLRIADVFEVAGGIQKTPDRIPRDNAFPYLGVANVYRGRLDLNTVKKFELAPGELERRRLEPSDLLIIEGNGSFNEIGRCAMWSGEIPDCVHQNHVIRCRPKDREIAPFILLFLNSSVGVDVMQRLAITSSGLYSLSVGKIRQIVVPVAPLAEQRRIIAKVDQLMTLVDQLEINLTASRATANRLIDAVVAELKTA
jgi:type I restriction enzyme S subunit